MMGQQGIAKKFRTHLTSDQTWVRQQDWWQRQSVCCHDRRNRFPVECFILWTTKEKSEMSNGKIEDEASSINFWLRWPEPGSFHSLQDFLISTIQIFQVKLSERSRRRSGGCSRDLCSRLFPLTLIRTRRPSIAWQSLCMSEQGPRVIRAMWGRRP